MGSFLRTHDPSVPSVRIDVPGVIPAGADYGIYMTMEAYESKEITISKEGKPLIVIKPDGTIHMREAAVLATSEVVPVQAWSET